MEYYVRLIDANTESLLEQQGPYYIEGRACYQAEKLSRKFSSPSCVAVVTVDSLRKGFPKVFRMGRSVDPKLYYRIV